MAMRIPLLFLAAAAVAAPKAPFVWDAPKGWKTETIPFPLEFAPSISHHGVEEIRFAPGMFKADSEQKWSYAFVWWLDGEEKMDAESLTGDLDAYFTGLALSAKEEAFDASKFTARVKLARVPSGHVEGTADIYDTFLSHGRVVLNADIELLSCGKHPVAFFQLSPKPRTDAVWKELGDRRRAFKCP